MRHQLTFVTGKGGAGKSTVAAALAIATTDSGLRTLLVELAGANRAARLFGRGGEALEEVELQPGLFAISVDPQLAMGEYLRIRMGAAGRALGSTKLFRTLSTTTPGMREMQTMAKIWELAHPQRPAGGGLAYDVVIVDAPSTGHAIGLLRTPRTFAKLARVGPVADGARMIATMVADPAFTGFVAVTTAEEMAVNETLFLRDALAADGLRLSKIVLNRLHPDRFTTEEVLALEAAAADASRGFQGAVRAAALEHRRAGIERAALERLGKQAEASVLALPFIFADELGEGELRTLAEAFS